MGHLFHISSGKKVPRRQYLTGAILDFVVTQSHTAGLTRGSSSAKDKSTEPLKEEAVAERSSRNERDCVC